MAIAYDEQDNENLNNWLTLICILIILIGQIIMLYCLFII